jgi:hypothetical protein
MHIRVSSQLRLGIIRDPIAVCVRRGCASIEVTRSAHRVLVRDERAVSAVREDFFDELRVDAVAD